MNESCKRYDRRTSMALRLIPTLAVAAICLASCASFEHLTEVGDNSFPDASQCGKCHVDIYNEWSQSDHAKAWTNEHFRSATNEYTFEACLNCHAPEPRLSDNVPAVRSADPSQAITCVCCHLDGDALAGPLEPTGRIQPHPISVRTDVFRGPRICGRCHEGAFAQWNQAKGDKLSCQQCHMEPVTRKITQATGGLSNILVAMEDEVPQRRHDFGIRNSQSSPEDITITAICAGPRLHITITNNVPHTLPTGDFGFRVLTLELLANDGQGDWTPVRQWELAPESGATIPAYESSTWSTDTPAGEAMQIILRRHSYDRDELILAQTTLELREP